MNPYNFSVLFFSFGAFMLGFLIYLKRGDELGKYYFFFSISATIWGVFYSIMVAPGASYSVALICSKIGNVSAMFIPILWLHITMIFSRNNKRKALYFFYLMGALISLTAFTPWFITSVKPIGDFKYYTRAGLFFIPYTFIFYSTMCMGFYELIKTIKRSEGEEKIQLIGLCVATFAAFVAGALTFFPCYGIDLPQYGVFLMPIYPFVMSYFMMKKNLFNLDALVEAAHKDKLAAIGTLATSINHEIRNPLYIVKGLAESHLANMKDGIYPDNDKALAKANEVLSKSVDQTARAMDIMKRFAMFAKQGVSQTAELELVNLEEIMSDILPLVSHELELDKIKLIQTIPAGITLNVDRRHIEEILFNLIVNACQAMKTHGVEGEIRISVEAKPNSVAIAIEDNGPGISADDLAKIFEPFYTTKQEGTGLGLYITKQLVERNGGKISVKSKLGQGTQFRMEFKA